MMNFKKTLLILSLAFAVACNNNDDSSDSNTGGLATDPLDMTDLNGSWTKICQAMAPSGFRKDSLVIDATTVQMIAQIYPQADGTCAGTADLEARANLNYTIAAFDPAIHNPVDMSLNQILAKVNSTTAAAIANASSFCGFNDWAVGVDKDVTGRNCVTNLPSAGGAFYQIFKLEDANRLFVGQIDTDHDGTTPAKRPTALEATPYTK